MSRANAVHMLIWPVWVPYQVVDKDGHYLGDWWNPLQFHDEQSSGAYLIKVNHRDLTIHAKTPQAARFLTAAQWFRPPQVKVRAPF